MFATLLLHTTAGTNNNNNNNDKQIIVEENQQSNIEININNKHTLNILQNLHKSINNKDKS
jgi:hypothetical protein